MAGESWWAMPGPMTDLSAHRAWVEHLPEDIGRLRAAVSQMLIHPALTKLYRLDLDGLRAREVQLRPAADIVDAVFARATGHGSARRATGVCRGFVVVFVAILRQAGVSAGSWCVPATSTRATAGLRRICGALTWCAATSSATAPRSRVPKLAPWDTWGGDRRRGGGRPVLRRARRRGRRRPPPDIVQRWARDPRIAVPATVVSRHNGGAVPTAVTV